MFRRLLATAGVATGVLLASVAVAGANTDEIHFPHQWGGGSDHPYKHRHDFCLVHEIQPGHSKAVWVDNGYGDTFHGRVYCSDQMRIPPHHTGPWDNGWSLSIPCPEGTRPMNGGAGFESSPEDALSFIDGSFGHNRDGWWHYRFHNWSWRTATVQMWAVCLNKH